MIVGSFNIRGGGSSIKRRVSHIICKENTDLFLVQERKQGIISDLVASSFLGKENIGYPFSTSKEASGKILILWNTSTVEVISSFKGRGYLGVKVI